jgi:hypothetical protein
MKTKPMISAKRPARPRAKRRDQEITPRATTVAAIGAVMLRAWSLRRRAA